VEPVFGASHCVVINAQISTVGVRVWCSLRVRLGGLATLALARRGCSGIMVFMGMSNPGNDGGRTYPPHQYSSGGEGPGCLGCLGYLGFFFVAFCVVAVIMETFVFHNH
jgi:hypothetical protein